MAFSLRGREWSVVPGDSDGRQSPKFAPDSTLAQDPMLFYDGIGQKTPKCRLRSMLSV